MKKTLSLIIILILFLIPALSSPSYLIRLKNGRQLTTPMYWFEGQRIFFYTAGGTAGMERTEIDRIEKLETDSDKSLDSGTREKTGLPQPSSDQIEKSQESGKRTVDIEQKPPISNTPKTSGKEATKKDLNVIQEFNRLEKKFESRKRMTVDELNVLKNDLTTLRDKIISSHSEEDFREEIDKIADMRFFTNDLIIIKTRSR
jgi:hypothetical protein